MVEEKAVLVESTSNVKTSPFELTSADGKVYIVNGPGMASKGELVVLRRDGSTTCACGCTAIAWEIVD